MTLPVGVPHIALSLDRAAGPLDPALGLRTLLVFFLPIGRLAALVLDAMVAGSIQQITFKT